MFYLTLVATFCYLALVVTLFAKLRQWTDEGSKLTRILYNLAGLCVCASGPVFWGILQPTQIDDQIISFLIAMPLLMIVLAILVAIKIRKDMLSQKLTLKQWIRQ
ncbi:hypothetical protein OPS25_13895 [Alteromonas ponticola]|uniref:Uncharacterized protein n=1 Tax=Alteromonas aquimaris TaxID=2998417 RepID=A0ABT3P9Y9_9ALTE|nr:hypothetical protein [Alteromonas aquimaris]MCW8109597.1 hypothetical protein [Alteromonas aquimaris]